MVRARKLCALFLTTVTVMSCFVTTSAKSVNVPVVYYKLPNGLKVVISEDHLAPVVTVGVYYNVGFRIEPKGRTGFAHLFEHMMFQGSANVKKFEHAKLVEANGGNLNGHTDFDYTNYFQTLPSNRVEMGLWLESDRMRSLDVSEENLKNQQNVVSEEVRVNVLNQPYQLFEWIDLWQNAFTNWNNSHNGYGDLAEINAATLDDVRNFFKTYYAPNNAVLTIAGDVDPNEVKKMVEKHFGSIPSQPQPTRPDLSEPPQTKEKRVTQPDKLATVPALATGYHIPAQNSPDFPAMALLVQILQGDESSRWYQRLIKEKAMTLDLSGGLNYFGNEFDYNGPMIMTTRTTFKAGHTADEIVREMDAAVAELVAKGVTAKELADAKVRFRSNFYSQLESTFGKVHLLCVLALFRDDPNQINSLLTPFESVTADQVKKRPENIWWRAIAPWSSACLKRRAVNSFAISDLRSQISDLKSIWENENEDLDLDFHCGHRTDNAGAGAAKDASGARTRTPAQPS